MANIDKNGRIKLTKVEEEQLFSDCSGLCSICGKSLTLWLTQQLIAELFDTTKQNVSSHIQNIFADGELAQQATVKDFLTVRQVVSGILRTFMIDYKTVHQA